MRRLTVGLLPALLTIAASAASAQDTPVARVTATEAIVRVSPAVEAAVVATPAIGSLLDVSAVKDDWVVVLLPPNAAGLRRYGYILRRSVEILTDRGLVPAIPSSATPSAAAPALAPDWDARFREAVSRKRSGQAKRWGGVGLIAGGVALVAVMTASILDDGPNRNCTDANPCYEYAWGLAGAAGMMVAGGIVSSRGKRQVAAATADLIRLETERINARPKTTFVLPIPGASAGAWATAVGLSHGRAEAVVHLRW